MLSLKERTDTRKSYLFRDILNYISFMLIIINTSIMSFFNEMLHDAVFVTITYFIVHTGSQKVRIT